MEGIKMKKMLNILVALFAAVVMFGCSTAKPDDSGWYNDYEAAKKIAAKQNKNVLLFVNSVYDIDGSQNAVKLLLETPEFVNGLKDSYVCVHFDFTDIMNLNVIDENAKPEEKKALEKKRATIEKQFAVADALAIQTTPAIVLTTSEGYYITNVQFDFASDNVEGYISMVKNEADTVKEVNDMVAATKKGTNLERVNAINTLYDSQSETHRLLLSNLCREVVKLDKNNESGLLSKYLFAVANADAYEKLIKLEVAEAIKVYEKAAEDARLEAADKQNLYYIAANILASSGTTDYEYVVKLLQNALDADPESSYAEGLQKTIDYVKEMQEQAKQAAADANADAK